MRKPRLGDVLKQSGALTDAELESAVREQQDRSVLLGELLLEKGMVPKEALVAALQEVSRVPYLDCQAAEVTQEALQLIRRDVALKYCCLPVAVEGRRLILAMAEPQNLQFLDDLRFITGRVISPRFGFRSDIRAAIEKWLPESGPVEKEAEEEEKPEGPQVDVSDMEFFSASSHQRAREAAKEFQAELRSQPTAAVRLLSIIICTAEDRKVSDIHIDPQATNTVVRMRVDGMLRDLLQIPQELSTQLVSRIKILADLDIAERRVPQDGRFLVRIGENKLDMRVATLPTHYGEKVVMRLLNPEATRVGLRDLGFSEEQSDGLSRILALPQGLLLVCGPTGSGKTTTLYSALHLLSARTVNIITVEDPVEYMVEGINQVQVNYKAGLTFSGCLRSILRQDPNVIMVGEIRDRETAEIALTAAQTGHLVLSTLHTNDSIAALDRLKDLDVPAFLVASSLTAVIAQRLLRKLCSCRAQIPVTREYEARLLEFGVADFPGDIYIPMGCEACDKTGYKGRIGVFELLNIEDEIRSLIRRGAGPDETRGLVENRGMRFMAEDALGKVRRGLTSLDEFRRVVPFQERKLAACPTCGLALPPSFSFCPNCGSKALGTTGRETVAPMANLVSRRGL